MSTRRSHPPTPEPDNRRRFLRPELMSNRTSTAPNAALDARRVIAALNCAVSESESGMLCLAFCYSAVMVSSRLRIMLAKVVQAATSRGSSVESGFDSPTDSSFVTCAWSRR